MTPLVVISAVIVAFVGLLILCFKCSDRSFCKSDNVLDGQSKCDTLTGSLESDRFVKSVENIVLDRGIDKYHYDLLVRLYCDAVELFSLYVGSTSASDDSTASGTQLARGIHNRLRESGVNYTNYNLVLIVLHIKPPVVVLARN